jgi:ABC-2 type transport system permease protein
MSNLGRIVLAFFRRDVQTTRSYRFALILQIIGIASSLWMYFFLSRTMGTGATAIMAPYGGDLFGFMVVGIAFWSLLSTALMGTLNAVRAEQRGGTMEAVLVTAAPPWLLMLGGVVLPLLIGLIEAACYLGGAAGVFHVDWSRANWGLATLIALLAVAHTATLGLLVAAAIIAVKRGDQLVSVLSGALALLTGIFYPVEVLPGPLATLAGLLPLTHALRALRQALFGAGAPGDLLVALAVLIGSTGVLAGVGLWALNRALAHARREGSLAGF